MEEIKNPKEKPIIKAKKPEEKTKILAKSIVRILGADISGEASIYPGLTRVKGVSWSFSNIICRGVKLDKTKLATVTVSNNLKANTQVKIEKSKTKKQSKPQNKNKSELTATAVKKLDSKKILAFIGVSFGFVLLVLIASGFSFSKSS